MPSVSEGMARRYRNARLLYERAAHIMPAPEELPRGWNDPEDWSGTAKAMWLYQWRVKHKHLPEAETPEERMILAGFEEIEMT